MLPSRVRTPHILTSAPWARPSVWRITSPIVTDMSGDGPSAEQIALAHELLDAMQFDTQFNNRYQLPAGLSTTDSPGAAALRDFQRQLVTQEMIRPHAVRRYADQLTADELRSLIAFFRSPLGRRFVGLRQEAGEAIRATVASAFEASEQEHRALADQYRDELRRKREGDD
jgi:hypothetical protein